MKHGLVVLDPTEIPSAEWDARLRAVQARLRAAGARVGLIYNDVSRGEDIGYLTNLVVYWNEGVLAIPAEGDPTLLTKLSKRVFSWMRRTSVLTDLRSGKSFGKLVGDYLCGQPAGAIGFIDADLWPAAYLDEIAAAAPEWTAVELGPLVREARAMLSAAELGVTRAGAPVFRAALAAADAAGPDLRARMGALESTARHGGFTDLTLRGFGADGAETDGAGADGAETDGAGTGGVDGAGTVGTIEVAGQYRHSWLLAGRSYAARSVRDRLAAAQASALGALGSGAGWPAVEAAARGALALPAGATAAISWIRQVDFANLGELRPRQRTGPAAGEAGALRIEVFAADGRRGVLTDTFLIVDGPPELLTA
ncbi:MAG: hypothetical protein FWD74_02785 [Actinomycetia bacterium]|nr:hypothetical protein [Actinomycetes bacterium]